MQNVHQRLYLQQNRTVTMTRRKRSKANDNIIIATEGIVIFKRPFEDRSEDEKRVVVYVLSLRFT